jgi:hypothetical protein
MEMSAAVEMMREGLPKTALQVGAFGACVSVLA